MTDRHAFIRLLRRSWWLALLLALWLVPGAHAGSPDAPAGPRDSFAAVLHDHAVPVADAAAERAAADHAHAGHGSHEPSGADGAGGASCPCHAACAAPAGPPLLVPAGVAEFLRAVEPALTPGREPAPEPRPPRG